MTVSNPTCSARVRASDIPKYPALLALLLLLLLLDDAAVPFFLASSRARSHPFTSGISTS